MVIRKYKYALTKSKNIHLLILSLASMLISRGLFLFIDDPEGPNLLIVLVLAFVIYGVLLFIYSAFSKKYKSPQ